MLNQLIARYLLEALSPLAVPNTGPISRLAGLVKTLETDAFTKGKVSRFPIPVDATLADCSLSGSAFPDLVPSQRERLLVYFEDFGSSSNGGKWTSKLRLVGWGNSTLFNVPGDQVTAVLIAKIERLLRKVRGDYGSPVDSLRCQIVGSPASNANLFGLYTYSETSSQYLLAPYFAFGLDLQLTFTLNDDCTFDLTGQPVALC